MSNAWNAWPPSVRYEHAPQPYPGTFTPIPYAAPRAPPAPYTTPKPAAAPPSSDIRVGDDGYIHGIDGMLDQVSLALARHAGPMLVRDVLPIVRNDKELHKNIGSAIGQRVADQVGPWLVLGAAATIIVALISAGRWYSETRG